MSTLALDVARSDAASAQQAIAHARADVARAEELYLVEPSSEREEQIERATKGLQSAERLAKARDRKVSSLEALLAEAEREKSEGELEVANEERAQLWKDVAERFVSLRNVYREATAQIAEMYELIQRDEVICGAANSAAARAGVAGTAKAIDFASVQRAFAISLTEGRRRAKHQSSQEQRQAMLELIGRTGAGHGTSSVTIDECAALCELALRTYWANFAGDTSAVGIWLSPKFPPPALLNGHPEANLHLRAKSLLAAMGGDPSRSRVRAKKMTVG